MISVWYLYIYMISVWYLYICMISVLIYIGMYIYISFFRYMYVCTSWEHVSINGFVLCCHFCSYVIFGSCCITTNQILFNNLLMSLQCEDHLRIVGTAHVDCWYHRTVRCLSWSWKYADYLLILDCGYKPVSVFDDVTDFLWCDEQYDFPFLLILTPFFPCNGVICYALTLIV